MADNTITLSPPSVDDDGLTVPGTEFIKKSPPTVPLASTLTPLTDRQVAIQAGGRVLGQRASPIGKFAERNVEGLPLETEEGTGIKDAFSLSLRRTKLDQLRYLQQKYGADKVRLADTGEDWIVRVPDETTGGEKDMLVDPFGMDLGDIGKLPDLAKEVAAWMLGSKAASLIPKVGKATGLIGGARNVLSGAAGVQAAGVPTDVMARILDGTPVDLPEIASSRTMLGALDAGLGSVTGLAGGFVKFLRNPFHRARSLVQIDGLKARDYLADKYGVYIHLTPGEATGSSAILTQESMLSNVQGGSVVFEAFDKQRAVAMEKLQKLIQGGSVPEEDVLGRKAIRALQIALEPTEQSLRAAQRELSNSALEEIESIAAGLSLPERQFTRTYVGDTVRNRVFTMRDEARASANTLYDEVRKLGGDEPNIIADDLADAAQKLLNKLPPRFRTVVTESGEETVVKTPSTAFVPESSVINRLNELIAARGQQFRLSDLQQMRRQVYDDMDKAAALPGYSEHYLSQIGDMLTEAMDNGVAKLPVGDLKAAFERANKFYKDEVLKFEDKGIRELFAPSSEKGHVGPAEIASRLVSGAAGVDKFNALKKLLGADSIEMRMVKRLMIDDVLGDSMQPGLKFIDANKLLGKLQSMATGNRDMFQEVFGNQAERIERIALSVQAAKDDKIPVEMVNSLLQDQTITAQKLRTALAAERKATATYRNRILDDIRKGKLEVEPEEFVNRFVDGASESETRQVMSLLQNRPALVEDIRAGAMQKLIQKSRASEKGVGEVLESIASDRKWSALFGPELLRDIKTFGLLQEATLQRGQIAAMAGAFARGSRSNMILNVPKYGSLYARDWFRARVLVSAPLRRWAATIPNEEPSKWYAIISSPPFLRAVLDEFGDSTEGLRQAQRFVGEFKGSLDRFWTEQQQGDKTPPPEFKPKRSMIISPPVLPPSMVAE